MALWKNYWPRRRILCQANTTSLKPSRNRTSMPTSPRSWNWKSSTLAQDHRARRGGQTQQHRPRTHGGRRGLPHGTGRAPRIHAHRRGHHPRPHQGGDLKFLKRMLDRLDDHRKRLQEAIYLAADDLYSDGLPITPMPSSPKSARCPTPPSPCPTSSRTSARAGARRRPPASGQFLNKNGVPTRKNKVGTMTNHSCDHDDAWLRL